MIIRRKLFTYSFIYTLGVITSYFYVENKDKVALSICFIMLYAAYKLVGLNKLCLLFFILGFILLQTAFFKYDRTVPSSLLNKNVKCHCRVINVEHSGKKYKLLCSIESINGKKLRKNVNILFNIKSDTARNEPYKYYFYIGRYINVRAKISKPSEPLNPHGFNYKTHLYSKDTAYTASPSNLSLSKDKKDGIISYVYYGIKRHITVCKEKFLYNAPLDKEISSLIRGVLFGDTYEIDKNTVKEFRHNGTAHILAVSGLHIGFIYALYSLIHKKWRHKYITFIFMLFLLSYGTLTLWAPSVFRAITLIFIKITSDAKNYPFDLTTALAAVAAIMTTINPYVVFNTGYQLSFIAAFSICFLTPVLSPFLGRYVGTLLSVYIGLAPYMIFTFHGISPITPLVNVFIIFLTSLLVPMLIVLFVVSVFILTIPYVLWLPANAISELTLFINRLFYFNSIFNINFISISACTLIAIYLFLFYLSSENFYLEIKSKGRKLHAAFILLLITNIFLIEKFTAGPFNKAVAHFPASIPSGSLVINDNRKIIIDGGSDSKSNTGENILLPFLLANNILKLDAAIFTSTDARHYLGIYQLKESGFPIKNYSYSDSDTILKSRTLDIHKISPSENSKDSIFFIRIADKRILYIGNDHDLDTSYILKRINNADIIKSDRVDEKVITLAKELRTKFIITPKPYVTGNVKIPSEIVFLNTESCGCISLIPERNNSLYLYCYRTKKSLFFK